MIVGSRDALDGAHSIDILDLRAEQRNPPRSRAGVALTSVRRGRAVERAPEDVDGVCLHQAAVMFGGQDRHRRALHVASHALAFHDGVGVLAHPVAWHVSGAGPLNGRVVHLEVEGLFAGVVDRLATVWGGRPPTRLTELGVETARATLRALVRDARAWGADLRYVYAHRQSSATRRADPGEALWRALVPWAERELGLSPRLDFALGDGRPIPREWDDRATASY